MKLSIACVPLVVLAIGAGHPTVRAQRADDGLIITNVRVFDEIRVIPSATVIVENQTITSIGVESRGAYTQIDGTGQTLLPGFIDGHDHIASNRESLRDAARFGVTTVIDLFDSRPQRMQALRRLVQAEPSCAEADYFSAGAGATVKGDTPTLRTTSRRFPLQQRLTGLSTRESRKALNTSRSLSSAAFPQSRCRHLMPQL